MHSVLSRLRRNDALTLKGKVLLGVTFLLFIESVALGQITALGAAPGVAQTFGAANTAPSTTLAAPPGSATGAGDLLVLDVKVRNTTSLATVSGVADSASNAWSKAASVTQGTQADMEVWYAPNANSVLSTGSVTVTVTAASALAFTVLDVTGALTAPLDKIATLSGSSTAASTGTTGTTSQASEIAIGAVGWNGTATPSGQTAGYTATTVRSSTASGSATGEQAAWQILTATGAQTYGATLSASVAWTGAIATFKLGSVGPVPTITSFSPTTGTVGTSVVITGTGFTGATAVKFNGTSQPTYTVNSATQITTTVPGGATTGKITVTTPGGTATSSGTFTVKPAISSFSPTSGPVGTHVVITGTGFTGATAVAFHGTAASTYHVDSSTQITATVASGTTNGTITVTTPGGTATSATSFTVTAAPVPTISSFSPTSGSVGTSVTITGTGFTGATAVTFNTTAQPTYTVADDFHISASVPAGATTGKIKVTTPGGTATSATSFTVSGSSSPHVMLIVMENKAYSSAQGSPYIIGSSSAPYINNTLVKNYRSATNWFAVEHNSPLDYYDLITGSNQSGHSKPFTATHLADELNTAKIPWKAYMESMPSNCYSGNPTLYYYTIHNPFAPFSDYHSLCSGNNGVVPYNAPFSTSQLKTDLNSATPPAFVWFTPNICNDMHTNGTPCGLNGVANGDTWLSTFIPAIQGTSWYTSGGIIVITWDESIGSDTSGGTFGTGGHIATLVISANAKGKGAFTPSGDHYAVLRAIEEEYGVGLLGSSSNASFGDLKPAF